MKLRITKPFQLLVVSFVVGASVPALAMDGKASSRLPFKLSVEKVAEVESDGKVVTVATVRLVNGERYIQSVGISCEARNAKGFTWQLQGKVLGLMPNQKRDARILSTTPAEVKSEWTKPNAVYCEVNAFDALPWSPEFPDAD